jgi:cytochrome c oxidase subunit 2
MLLSIVPPSASNFAAQNDQLFILITILVGVWFVAAEAMFFWLIFRFRARPGVPTQYITGKEKALHRWVSWPHFLILVCDVVIIIAAVQLWVRVKQTLPPADRTIRVVAQQWAWTFTDPGPDKVLDTPDDVRTTDELHLVIHQRYHFLLESKDVLHSFFIPAFRLKQDAIPGRIYTGWFETTRAGSYDLLCAEICGMGHGEMGARVVVEGEAEHATWLTQHANDAALAALNTAPAPADTTAPAAPATAGAH